MDNSLILIVGLIVAGIAVFAGIGIYRYRLASASAAWSFTQGKIVSAKMQRAEKIMDDEEDEKREYYTYPELCYEYTVNGQTHRGTRISFAPVTAMSPEWVDRFPDGSAVRVYFDPKNPKQSVLIPGRSINATTPGDLDTFLAQAPG